MKNRSKLILASIILALAVAPAFGATQAANTNTISPTLKVNVTVQDAIALTLSQGSGCAITAGWATSRSSTAAA